MWIAHWKPVRAQQSFAMSAKTLDPEYWIHRTRAWQKKTKNIESNELNLKHYNFCSRFLLSSGNLRLLWTPSPSFKWRFFSSWKKNGGLDIEASTTLHIAVVARRWPHSTCGRRRQTQNPSRDPSCSLNFPHQRHFSDEPPNDRTDQVKLPEGAASQGGEGVQHSADLPADSPHLLLSVSFQRHLLHSVLHNLFHNQLQNVF